jgi:hypothetical protein
MSRHDSSPADTGESRGFSLRRWSRRKHAAAREQDRAPAAPAQPSDGAFPEATAATASTVPAGVADGPAVAAGFANGAAPTDAMAASPSELPRADRPAMHQAAALPPIESLTPDSDFAAFMRPGVDESLKRGALKRLFTDPHFNVMDGLDIYIDDYTKPDPVEPSIARALLARITFDSSANAPAGDPVTARAVSALPAVPAPATGIAELACDDGKPERAVTSASADGSDANVVRNPEALPGDVEALLRERDMPPTSR